MPESIARTLNRLPICTELIARIKSSGQLFPTKCSHPASKNPTALISEGCLSIFQYCTDRPAVTPCRNYSEWQLVEERLPLTREHEIESFAVSNGYTGPRPSLEEGMNFQLRRRLSLEFYDSRAVPELFKFPEFPGKPDSDIVSLLLGNTERCNTATRCCDRGCNFRH